MWFPSGPVRLLEFTISLAMVSSYLGSALAQSSQPQSPPTSSSSSPGSSSSKDKKHDKATPEPGIDSGTVVNGVYRNRALGMTCKIPEGWVLRTEEMNEREEESQPAAENAAKNGPSQKDSPQRTQGDTEGKAKVLLAAFSRPPAAHGEDVNASILIAAEPVEAYPGLKEPVQYLAVLTEAVEAQGFTTDVEPYEIAIGPKALVRDDYHKDAGTRVIRQSTMAMLARGYAVSITVIGGTEDEVEDLLDGIEFAAGAKK
jgi:hypothetical protein